MSPSDKIERTIMNMMESIKDSTGAKISEAVATGQLKVDPSSVGSLIALVASTIDAGYYQAASVLKREITASLSAANTTSGKKKTS